jgi:DNA-binding PadR family transcriptional regulator
MSILTLNEGILLLAIHLLKDEAYGVTIMEKMQAISPRQIVFGTLYNSLAKLKEKGYVRTEMGEPTPQRGGKCKVYYSLTAEGLAALHETRELHLALWSLMPESERDRS